MTKQYVLDTSVLIFDPNTIKSFPDCEIVLPISVLNELDKLKKFEGTTGKNARVAIRLIDEIANLGDISVGVLLDNDALIKVDTTYIDTTKEPYLGLGDPSYGDTQILACAMNTMAGNTDRTVCLVSNDIALRIKARSHGIEAESHDNKGGDTEDLYSGVQVVQNADAGASLVQTGSIDPRCFDVQLNMNEFVVFQGDNGDEIAYGRKTAANKVKQVVSKFPWGCSPKNIEQSFAIDLIMDRNVDLVTLAGKSGTGKTYCALACCLELVLNKREYDKLIIIRPTIALGADLGFLPGELGEKLDPYFGAIYDNLESLFTSKNGANSGAWKQTLELYQKKGRIELSAITFFRGRSVPNCLVFLDEAQNLSAHEIKAIATRMGISAKLVISGDIEQIDNKNVNAMDNGLSVLIEKFKNSELAGTITFKEGVRSRLATFASEIL